MKQRVVWILGAFLLLVFAVSRAPGQQAAAPADPFAEADAKILAEIQDHSEVMANLEYLSDVIGPRLTGTERLKRANEWTAEMFRKYGLTNVHLEPWTIARSWTRGTARARIVSPTGHPITIASAGWSPSTPGVVRGPVVYVNAQKKEDLEKFRGKLKSAIVILTEPSKLSPPAPERESPMLGPMQAPPPLPGQPRRPSPFAAIQAFSRVRSEFFKEEGVAAVLRDSSKPHGLLNMGGIGGEKYEVGLVPTAFVTTEGYGTIWRLLQRDAVEMEIELTNSFSDAPVEVYNTVAELRGSEKPGEVVILGAHLDSWDLGTGATDNGTGSMAVLEAARTLGKLDLKPKRTIRFVLFTGEEQGLVGSERYVESHKAELDKISAVLVHDTGTGRVLALALHDNYQAREIVDRVLAPLSSLKLLEPSMRRTFGTDHASFDDAGVPGFYCVQDMAEYSKTHHSQSDTFDKVWKDDLVQGAQVLAAWAYNTAQLPEMLPRRPVPPPADRAASSVTTPPDPVAEVDKKILEQVKNDKDEMLANLRHLADRIGPRVTGTPQLDQASHWTADQFRSAGLANVKLEPWTIASAWTRGTARGRILAPAEQTLILASAGWSPSTKGALRGAVTGIKAEKPEDLAQYKGKLKGAIVLIGPPLELDAPRNPILTPYDQPALPLAAPRRPGEKFDLAAFIKLWRAEIEFFKQEGVAAVLFPSDKWYGLLNVFSMSRGTYQPGGFSLAFVAGESHHLLWRLLDGGPVQVELEIQNTFSKKPVEVYNTVAEIPGTEKPDEVVIVGAHLDSWDLGTGATDNGTGSMAVLEAARALQKLGVKPKRTIRFVLFTGEEQGLNGSRKYVEAHKAELGKISGMLVHDTGTGRVLTVGMMSNYAALETLHRVAYPLAAVGLVEPSLRTEGGSDHVPFDEAGVPASWCIQEPADYDRTHHSQADTFDRVRPDDLMEGAQVLAVWAYNVAQLPELLPRKPAPPPKPPGTSPQ